MKKKEQYIYNPETLTYEFVKASRKRKFITCILVFILIPGLTMYIVNYMVPGNHSSLVAHYLMQQQKQYYQKLHSLSHVTDSLNIELKVMEERDNKVYSAVAERDPLPVTMREAGYGGSKSNARFSTITHTIGRKTESLLSRARVQQKSFEEIYDLLIQKDIYWEHMPVIPPLATNDVTRKGDGFGRRFHPILKYFRPHEGLDLIADKGKPIHAPAKGKIIETRYSLSFGNVIKIQHNKELVTLFAHLNKFNVKEGDTVMRGDTIGFVGSTGLSSGSHLHYEIHRDHIPVNPELFFHTPFTQKEYEEVINVP